jgi:hypothetical protein
MTAAPQADMAVLARLYHAVPSAFVDEGGAPHYTGLAHRLGLPPEETRLALHRLCGLGLPIWLHPGTDLLAACAPFSNLPTQYPVTVNGERRWYGQCGLESLAISWLFPGREVRIEAGCLDCGEPLAVRMRDGALLEVDPPSVVGHVNLPLRHWRDDWAAT